MMQTFDNKKLRSELVSLLDSQLDTLQKECFSTATDEDMQAYESRRERINQLCDELMERKAAA